MGTSGMIGVIEENNLKLHLYTHMDSYPDGVGKDMVDFIHNFLNDDDKIDIFKARIAGLIFMHPKEPVPRDIQELYQGYANTLIGTGSLSDWYVLLRNIQGIPTFEEIFNNKLKHFPIDFDAEPFIVESLFCEYAYIINLDNRTLECYKGMQKEPQPGNRFGEKQNGDGYYPCKLLGSLSLVGLDFNEMRELYNLGSYRE